MKNLLFLLFAATVLILNHSWLPGMFMDGGIYATLGMNAAIKGHWLVPHFSPRAFAQFAEHPPFFFIFEGILFKIFGVSWSVARIAGALFNLATITIIWTQLKRLKGEYFSYVSSVILLLTIPYLKQSRFPNMDVPLTLFITASLLFYYAAFLWNRRSDWILCGAFFGFGLMIKGHPALFIPGIIIIHLLVTKSWKRLGQWTPWYSFAMGLSFFLIWPLLLKLFHGDISPFIFWFKRQFIGTVVESRGGRSSHFLFYFRVVLKYCLPWVLLAIWGARKSSRDTFYKLALIWVLMIIVPLSFVGWKLAHYILPLYPGLAILAAFGVTSISSIERGFATASKGLFLVIALVMLCFPVSNEIRRDRKIHYTLQIFETLKVKPTAFALVDQPRRFWSFAPAVAFPKDYRPYRITGKQFDQFLKDGKLFDEGRWAFIVSKKYYHKRMNKRVEKFLDLGHDWVLVEKDLIPETLIYPKKR